MDPFEEKVQTILQSRLNVAEKIVTMNRMNRGNQEIDLSDESIQERLPYSISKTVQYLKADEYSRNQKALKKQRENI